MEQSMTSAFPSSVALVLDSHAPLIDTRRASPLALEAAVEAMAQATRAALAADLKCYLAWCSRQRPVVTAIPATPETLVHYLRWLNAGSAARPARKPATLARRIASIARAHRILGFGEREPLPTQAGMVRDTLKGVRRTRSKRQKQAAPLRYGEAMAEGQAPPDGITVQKLLAACGPDLIGLRDAALISLAYDAGLRVSELVSATVEDLRLMPDGTGRLDIVRSKTDQEGEGTLAWLSPDAMQRLSAWLAESGVEEGPVFRRINRLLRKCVPAGMASVDFYVGGEALTRQGVVGILRRRSLAAIGMGLVELEPGVEAETVGSLSAHSFRVGLTQDLFAAGEDGAGIALALRWSSANTALRYAREIAVGSNAAARVLGRIRGG